jgi:hypothetical protein
LTDLDKLGERLPPAETAKQFMELDTSLQLSPGNTAALGIAGELSYDYPDLILKNGSEVILLWLTATIAPTHGEAQANQITTETSEPSLIFQCGDA